MDDVIKEKLKEIPECPGIYKMLDKNQSIIYIGKSKCLKKRVHSYFVPSPKWEKAKKMAPRICDIEWEVTDTHLEAMLLECRLIKEIKPYFNVMMKNDEKYFYLNVSYSERKSSLFVTYERQEHSYGPFRSRGMVEALIQTMKNFYPLRLEGDSFVLEYHLFPIQMRKDVYLKNAEILCRMFKEDGLMENFRSAVEKQMIEIAAMQRFELAVRYREFLENIAYVQNYINETRTWMKEDVIYRVKSGDKEKLFYINKGMIVHSALYKRVTAVTERNFVKAAEKKCGFFEIDISEKSRLDYMDIVFSELMQADNNTIKIVK